MSKIQLCRIALYVMGSLLVHSTLIGAIFFYPQEDKFSEIKVPIDVTPTISRNDFKVRKSRATKKLKSQKGTKLAKSFIPSWYDLSKSVGLLGIHSSGYSDENSSSTSIKSFGYNSTDLSKLQDFSIYDFVYKKIDYSLQYPWILANRHMEAVVNVQTRILTSGTLDWQNFKISGGSPYFQVYVLRVIKTVLNEIPKAYVSRVQKPLPLDMSFTFKISENGEKDFSDKKQFIMGQVLAFHRVSHQSAAQWNVGPISGLFPIPFASLDILKLINLFSKEDDPLLKFMTENQL